jgi:hypothetical protein
MVKIPTFAKPETVAVWLPSPPTALNSYSIKTMLVVEDANQKTSPIFAP